jgi:hypothetical protein
MNDEFGVSYAQVLQRDLVLGELGDKTGSQLLAEGEDPRAIWIAICRVSGVPKQRWTGVDKIAKKQHAE